MTKEQGWGIKDMPDLSAKTILVTGANSGLGFQATQAFAAKGAHVVMACRDTERGEIAAEGVRNYAPEASVEVEQLDLASLESVRVFARTFLEAHSRLDVLCNNAGIMAIPKRLTADGFEMQFGTNHLGHFALTGLLFARLAETTGGRVVTLSSSAHSFGKIRFDDLQWKSGYRQWPAYGQSKLANLLFALELDRRLRRASIDLKSVGCHPGYAATNLQYANARMTGSSMMESFWKVTNDLLAQSPEMGSLPTLYAATAPDVEGGDYIGPDGWQQWWGYPTKVTCAGRARDEATADHLWEVSEQLTGVKYP
ncbi:MAG: SDR family NAD(P)-dependent oxidoreductase [Myxococcales bacterium]|jgi:NAD(P)-dependent dehydrogenase (short-subunit alcohol dehydrogenase family)|nr:MAG: SDR family NAD(P)-dependent oxidoreductase [Myxococcales bacterium]